jgi:hypothetical protein
MNVSELAIHRNMTARTCERFRAPETKSAMRLLRRFPIDRLLVCRMRSAPSASGLPACASRVVITR